MRSDVNIGGAPAAASTAEANTEIIMAAEAVLGWARRFAERGLPAEAASTTLPAVLWYTPAWNHSSIVIRPRPQRPQGQP